MVERNLTKSIYKIELVIIKFIPYIIALVYLLNNILSYIGIDLPILSLFAGTSILTILFLYISSFVFKFCIYHRLFLYYVLVSDLINYCDRYFGIPITNRSLFALNLIIAGIFLFLILYTKFKVCKR
jgi:hypothetical protein